MVNNLDPDQARHFVGLYLGPNCLQRLSADDTQYLCLLSKFLHALLSSADYFQSQVLRKILSRIPSECQTIWIQIRPDFLSGLIWVQTVCKGYQQTTSELFVYWVILHALLSSADFFRSQVLRKILSRIPSECQSVWIQIGPNILSRIIWVQIVCKGQYQQTTLSRI